MIVDANENNFNKLVNTNGIVIVDFFTTWCGPCKMFLPILEEFAKENSEIITVKVDVDINANIASYYGVISVPTIMFFKDGNPIKQIVGFHSKQELENIISQIK